MPDSTDSDLIHRFLLEGSDIRGEIVTLDTSFKAAAETQGADAALMPLFGEFLAGVCLISEMLKFDGLVTLQARGDGSVPIIMAEADHLGHLRGVVDAVENGDFLTHDTQKLKAIGELLGSGVLTLTLDPRRGQRYQGVVPLDGANLASCIKHYFEQSEQVPTFVALFADTERCGGILLQCLPAQNTLDEELRAEQWHTCIQLASTMAADEFFELPHELVLKRLFHELGYQVFEPRKLGFKCRCSRERSQRAILSLGESELKSLIEEAEPAEINCHFCGTSYTFDVDELSAMLQTKH